MTEQSSERRYEEQYADILAELDQSGLRGVVIGGPEPRIVVALENGFFLQISDLTKALPLSRADHSGWCVALHYPESWDLDDYFDCAGTDGSTSQALLEIIHPMLRRLGKQ